MMKEAIPIGPSGPQGPLTRYVLAVGTHSHDYKTIVILWPCELPYGLDSHEEVRKVLYVVGELAN